MDASVALDSLMPLETFVKFQKRVSRDKAKEGHLDDKTKLAILRDDTRFINYPECRFGEEGINDNGFVKKFIEQRNNLPDEIKKNSPFYPFLLCPNLIKYFRSHEVFWQLAGAVENLPQVKETGELRALYPASGSHLAPLDLFHHLIQQGKIGKATIIFTEVSNFALLQVRYLLQGLQKRKVYTDLKEEIKKYLSGGTETIFTFKYLGKEIKLVFALNRSGDDYYREDYLSQSALWIVHDPGDGTKSYTINLLSSFMQSLSANPYINQPPVIVMENINDTPQPRKGGVFNVEYLKGEKQKISFPYGHRGDYNFCHEKYYLGCDGSEWRGGWNEVKLPDGRKVFYATRGGIEFRESSFAEFNSALVFTPDLNFWNNLSPLEIKTFFSLTF